MKNKNNEKSSSCTYYIDGMHCSSCEVTIEKTLLKNKSVKFADASIDKGEVNFTYKGNKPSVDELNNALKESGYVFFEESKRNTEDLKFIRFIDGKLVINKSKLNKFFYSLLISLIVILGFVYLQQSSIASKIVINQTSSYFTYFVFGIMAGLSSCAALVGGLLLSLSKQWNEMYIDSQNLNQKLKPYIMFTVGRIVSFIALGGVLGIIGSILGGNLNNKPIFSSMLVIIISLVMLVLGLQMLEVKLAYKLKIALPKFLTQKIANEENFKGKYIPFLVGALTFFLPCGFTLIAQGYAFSSGDILRSSMMMFAFVLGTTPMLLLIGLTSAISKKPKFNAIFTLISGIIVVIFSIYNINAQLNALGVKSLSDIKIFTNDVKNTNFANIDKDGYQVINIVAKDFSYEPVGSTNLKAGIKTKIIIDNQGIEGCGVYLSATGLIDKYAFLNNGINTVIIDNPKTGNYKLTCSMGMVPPVPISVK